MSPVTDRGTKIIQPTLSEEEGAARRSRYTGVVMRAVMAGLRERSRNPLAAHSLAWTLTGNLGVDSSTGLTGLIGLARTALGAGADSVEVVRTDR